MSGGYLGKEPACKVQGSYWVEKILGVMRIRKKQVGQSGIPGSSLHGTTCFHVLAPFVKVKMPSGLET